MIYLFPFGGLVGIKNLSYEDNIQLCCSLHESEVGKTSTIMQFLGFLDPTTQLNIRQLWVLFDKSVSLQHHRRNLPPNFFWFVCLFFFIKLKLFHLLTSRWSSICFLQTRFLQLPKQIQIVQRTAASLLTGRCEREHIVLIFSVLHLLAWFVMIRDFSVNSLSSTRTRPQNTFRPCNLNFLVVVQVVSSSAEELGVFNLLVTIRHCKGRKMAGHPSLLLLLTSETKKITSGKLRALRPHQHCCVYFPWIQMSRRVKYAAATPTGCKLVARSWHWCKQI